MEATTDNNRVFSEYFCIFCDDNFATIHEAYEHYKSHMNIATFCKVCDKALNRNCSEVSAEDCDVDHVAENGNLESEQSVIEMWIERLLTYQEELIDKSFHNIVTGNKFFLGCPVCDHLIKMCGVEVPSDITQKYKSMEISNTFDVSAYSSSNKDNVKCHTARHACAHLRYYPYECYACEEVGRYQKKPDISEMLRHIKDAHGKDVRIRENWESIIKHVTITKVEKFMDYYLKSRPMLRFDPIVPSNPKKSTEKLPVKDGFNLKSTSVTISTVSSPDSSSSESKGNKKQPPQSSTIPTKDQKTIETVVYNFSSQNLHKNSDLFPDEKNLKFTITRNKNSVANNSSLESSQSSFQRHFGNIFDDEEMMKFPINQEEDLNTEYFCVFCDSTFKDKDEARRHYQKHVNYYPMMCSLCGEGATDMQEFLKHHTEVHPDADKGRYKRREQPLVDKWINGFLYAQATVIRAFPAREQCPVCEKVFTAEQIKAARPRRCTVNRKIDHVHRHLCYLPYECVKCKEEGKEFVVAYFESKAHSHIKLKHPEIDDTESRWFVFQKTISIPKLDDYVADFFTKFGISMEYERRPVKKQCRETFSSPDFLSVYGNTSTHTSLTSNSLINKADKSTTNSGTMIIISQSQIEKKDIYSSRNNDGVIILDDDVDENANSSGTSLLNCDDQEAMVVEVSPSHAEYLRSDGNNFNGAEYLCIFCSFKFSNKLEAYPHFGEHLDYKPVACLLCENRFHDIEQFTSHHQSNHQETTDLMYEIREDTHVERWVDEFLDAQQSSSTRELTLSCSCAACCPVCDAFRGDLPLTQCVCHSDIDFTDHIYQHLAYYTYECSLCKKFGRTTRVPDLGSVALNHLQEQHMIHEANFYQLGYQFPKTLAIPKLEKFITESVQKKRSLEKKLKGGRVDKSGGQTGANGVSDVCSSGFLSKISQNQANFLKGVAHVRVEGGRVVNLPSSISIRAIQQKHQKQTIDLKQSSKSETVKSEGVAGVPAVRFYVKCLHCNTELPSRKQLKIHHQQEHPGLSMACFTTPKSLLSLGSS